MEVNQKSVKAEEGTKDKEKDGDESKAPFESKDEDESQQPQPDDKCGKSGVESEVVKDTEPSDAVIKLSPSDLEMSESEEEDEEPEDSDDDDDVKVKEEVESDDYDSSDDEYFSPSWNGAFNDEKKLTKKNTSKLKVEDKVLMEKAVKRKASSATKRPRGRPKQPRRLGAPEDYTSDEDEDEKAKKPILRQGSGYPAEFKLKVLKYAETHSNAATADKFGLQAKRIRDWKKSKDKIEEESKGSWKRRPRTDGYTVEEKLQAVAFALERSADEARLLYNVDRRTIEKWKAKKATLEARMQNGEGSFIRRVGSGRKPRYIKIEERLRDWIVGLRLKGLVVNNRMILTKAKTLMEEDPSMQGLPVPRTVTWVVGFLKRQNLYGLIGTTLGHEDPQEILKTGDPDAQSLVEKIMEIPENPNKRHRRTISIQDKVNIISRIEHGETQGTVAKSLKVATSTIQTIWSCRNEIMHKYVNPKSKTSDSRIWKVYSVVGAALQDWLEQNSTKIAKVDCSTLMDKAIQLAETYRLTTFNDDAKHWLRVFCKRHNLQEVLQELKSNQNILPSASTLNNNSQVLQSQPVQISVPTTNTSVNSVESSDHHHDDDFQTDFNFSEILSQMQSDPQSRTQTQNHSLQVCLPSLSNPNSSHHQNQIPSHSHHAGPTGNLSSHRFSSVTIPSTTTNIISSNDAVKYISLLRSWIHTNYGPHEDALNNHLSVVEDAVLKKRITELGHGHSNHH